jgi:hypothetical protein
MTVAMETMRRSPPERWWGTRSAKSAGTHGLHGRRDPAGHLGLVQTEIPWAEGDVLGDAGTEELVIRVLEHQAHVGAEPPGLLPADSRRSRCCRGSGVHDAGDGEEEGRLAGAVGPDDAHLLAVGDVQVHPVQHAGPAGKGDGQVADLQHGERGSARPPPYTILPVAENSSATRAAAAAS